LRVFHLRPGANLSPRELSKTERRPSWAFSAYAGAEASRETGGAARLRAREIVNSKSSATQSSTAVKARFPSLAPAPPRSGGKRACPQPKFTNRALASKGVSSCFFHHQSFPVALPHRWACFGRMSTCRLILHPEERGLERMNSPGFPREKRQELIRLKTPLKINELSGEFNADPSFNSYPSSFRK
jgi:hypothetical protein